MDSLLEGVTQPVGKSLTDFDDQDKNYENNEEVFHTTIDDGVADTGICATSGPIQPVHVQWLIH